MFSWATFSLGGPCPAPPARPEEAVLLRPPGFGVHQALEGTHYRGSPWWGWRAKCPGFSSEWRLAVLSVVYSCTRVPLHVCRLPGTHAHMCHTVWRGRHISVGELGANAWWMGEAGARGPEGGRLAQLSSGSEPSSFFVAARCLYLLLATAPLLECLSIF